MLQLPAPERATGAAGLLRSSRASSEVIGFCDFEGMWKSFNNEKTKKLDSSMVSPPGSSEHRDARTSVRARRQALTGPLRRAESTSPAAIGWWLPAEAARPLRAAEPPSPVPFAHAPAGLDRNLQRDQGEWQEIGARNALRCDVSEGVPGRQPEDVPRA